MALQSAKHLSVTVIVPCFRKGSVIAQTLRQMTNCFDRCGIQYRIRVVLDGPDDSTRQVLMPFLSSCIEVIELPSNLGKGGAIRCGSEDLETEFVAYIDADLDLHPNGIVIGLETLRAAPEEIVVAYGSKRHPKSEVRYPVLRKVASRCFQVYTRAFLGLNVQDTQVGLKVFRTRQYQEAVRDCVMNGFAFDVEILSILKSKDFQAVPIPIQLEFQFNSTVRFSSALEGLRDVYLIRKQLRQQRSLI